MISEVNLDAAYADLHVAMAGMLPSSRHAVTEFNRSLQDAARAVSSDLALHTSIDNFQRILREDSVLRMLVMRMIDEVPADYRTVGDMDELLGQLNLIIRWAPKWEPDPEKRNFFPMSALFAYMMMTTSGLAAFRMKAMNAALLSILREWCRFLDSPDSASVLTDMPDGWLSPAARKFNKLFEFKAPDTNAPHWGWRSYNAFFHREIHQDLRPVGGVGDPRVVVSPNDGTIYRVARNVALESRFWIKSQPYSVQDMLAGSKLTAGFAGGDVFQSYLQGADYHRWHAPVSGKIIELQSVEGLMFSNLASEGNDIKGTGSQGYYSAVNTRGLCFIRADHKPLGIVCVMPIGITEISSIRHIIQVGDHVNKGDELGRFSYGGSSLAVLFQPGAVDFFTRSAPKCPGDDATIKVNATLAESY